MRSSPEVWEYPGPRWAHYTRTFVSMAWSLVSRTREAETKHRRKLGWQLISTGGEDTIRVMAIWRGYWEACILQIVSVVVRTEVSRTAQALGRTCSSFWGGQWFLLSKTSFHVLFSLSLEVFPSQLFTVGRRHKEQRKTSTPRLAWPALLKDPILW